MILTAKDLEEPDKAEFLYSHCLLPLWFQYEVTVTTLSGVEASFYN